MNSDNPKQIEKVASHLRSELLSIGIPPRPAAIDRVETEMNSDAPNYSVLEKLISLDVGVSGSLLKMANSAFFGFSGNVRSVQDSLQVLGLNNVSSAIAALALKKVFASVPNLERFWDSSACIAQVSGWLATQIKIPEGRIKGPEAYTFGLFRDCGIPLLMFNYSDYVDVLKLANQSDTLPFTDAEDEELGLNHAIIGSKLIKEWKMPIEFHVAVEHHHDRDVINGTKSPVTPNVARYFIAIAQLAEYLFQRQTGLNKTKEWGKLGEACLGLLDLTEQDVDELSKGVAEDKVHVQRIC
jgi:HD-like signal output (HDOD) protein